MTLGVPLHQKQSSFSASSNLLNTIFKTTTISSDVDTAITSTTLDYYGYETDIIMTYMNIDN
jgi:hypothetical protein